MKRLTGKLSGTMAAIGLIGALAAASGQDSIIYHPGPIPLDNISFWMNLDDDGTGDYVFNGYILVGLPSPGFPNTLTPLVDTLHFNRNDYLMGPDTFGRIQLKPAGTEFGPQTAAGEVWGRMDFQAQLISSGFGSQWAGFSGTPPECFLGVRFLSGERRHYGWIRFLVPTVLSNSTNRTVFPVIADWAYEARPDTAIQAGALGANDQPVWFTVDFQNPDGTLHESGFPGRRSTGACVLLGDMLRYEMTLGEVFSTASIRGPAPAHARSMRMANLGQPLFALPGFCVFLGEVQLSRSEIVKLRHEAAYVSLGDGGVTGSLSPVR